MLLLDGAEFPEWLEDTVRVVRVNSLLMKKISGMQSVDSTEATALMRIPASFLNLNAEENDEAECHSWFGSTHRLLVLDGIQVQEASYLFSWYGYATFNSFQLLNTGPWQSRYFTEVSDGFWLGKEDTM